MTAIASTGPTIVTPLTAPVLSTVVTPCAVATGGAIRTVGAEA